MNKRLISLALSLALCLSMAVPALAAGSTFSDVPESHWACAYVERAVQEGVLNGMSYNEATGERRFAPNDPLTTAQFLTILCRKYYAQDMADSSASGAWYAAAQETAERRGLLQHLSSGAGMTAPISRSDMAAVLYALLEDQNALPSQADCLSAAASIPDLNTTGAEDAVAAVVFLGIINGVDGNGTFDGKSSMTRAQAAAVYCRASDVLGQPEGPEASQPETSKPEPSQPEVSKPDASVPETAPVQTESYEEFTVGDTIHLTLRNTEGADIKMESSDPAVLSVTAGGILQALTAGKADLTVTVTWPDVTQIMVTHVTVTAASSSGAPDSSGTPGSSGVESQGNLLANGKAITEDNVREIIYGLKSQYPEGMHWTNDNDYLSQAMRIHGYGCAGFALICSDAAFGSLPLSGTHSDFDRIRAGDMLRVDNDTHTVVVLEKKADSVVVAEGNYNNSIHWGREITRSELVGGNFYVQTRYPA